ncbi:MAG: TetR/AcrR family transcriptional regulator [Armatimonas sp.]
MFQFDCANSESDCRILERAATVLAEGHGRTMQEIADKSGVGRTTLYRRFRTREDLLRAIFEQAIVEARDGIAAANPEDGDAREAITRVVEELLKIGDKYRVLFQEKTAHTERAEGKDEFVESLRELIRRAQREGVIDPAVPVEWALGTLGAMVATATRLIGTGELARNHAADLITRSLLDGVGAPQLVLD